MELPYAFESSTPATYHTDAVEKQRKYVRILGSSLSEKESNVLAESAKTYQTSAEQAFCQPEPLIPSEEQNQVLVVVGIKLKNLRSAKITRPRPSA